MHAIKFGKSIKGVVTYGRILEAAHQVKSIRAWDWIISQKAQYRRNLFGNKRDKQNRRNCEIIVWTSGIWTFRCDKIRIATEYGTYRGDVYAVAEDLLVEQLPEQLLAAMRAE